MKMMDENKTDDMVSLLKDYHSHVKKLPDGSLDHKLCVGKALLHFIHLFSYYCSITFPYRIIHVCSTHV